MPAVDTCEPAIIRALQKEGWEILSKPMSIEYGDTYVFADLQLQKLQGEIVQQIIINAVKLIVADLKSETVTQWII